MKSDAPSGATRIPDFAVYFAVVAISSAAAVYLLHLRHADLRVPFEYRRDALLYSGVIKSVIDHGWFWRNPSIGAPDGLQLYDYPNVAHEALHLLAIKGMSLFTHDWALLLNTYFLLGFPLIALVSLAVFRRLGVSDGPAVVGSVLYAFLPTRLLKGEGHIFLDTFYQVPLAILMLLWVCSDAPPVIWLPRARRGPDYQRCRRRGVAALMICALNACTSAYYSFFAICLLVAGGLWASTERRSIRNVVAGVGLAATITVGIAAMGWPSIAYHVRQGPNGEVGQRAPGEAELFGMKVAQLLLPADGHRIGALRQFKERYNASAPFSGENSTTSLGFVADVGFLALLAAIFVRRRYQRTVGDWFLPLAKLNLAIVLLATIGGFGSLFAYLVYPQIRTYSRAGVFIGFFCLLAIAHLFDRLKQRHPRLVTWSLPLVLVAGLLDQATPLAARPYAEFKRAFASDRDLVRAIEARVPPGTIIFQLPYVRFPEGFPVQKIETNDVLRPYLHSSTLRWSLPTMHGRSGALFAQQVAERAPAEILSTLAATGFGGILIDRNGYPDRGAAIEGGFRAGLGAEPIASADGRLAFFDLGSYHAGLTLPPTEIDRMLHPIAVGFSAGFYAPESGPNGAFRWCQRAGEMDFDNDARLARRFSVRATLVPAHPPAHLTIDGDLVSAQLDLTGPTSFARVVELLPGHHALRLTSNGRPADAPTDPREMVWRLESFAFEELPASPADH